jgi:hypothetical protein
MKKTLRLLFIVTLLTSCASKEQQNAGTLVAKLWDAQNSTVGSSSAADTKKGTSKSLTLTLENLKGIKADYPNENVTSISAYTFIHNIPPDEYKDYENIKVTIKNNSSIFEKSYKIADVILAKEMFVAVDKFSKKITSGNLTEFESLIDKQSIPDSTIKQVKNAILAIDSAMGRQNKATVIRFDFDHLKESHEPVMIAYVETSNETSYSVYKLILLISDKKIIYIGINEN